MDQIKATTAATSRISDASSSSLSTPCDRRLSRAARELVLEQLGPILLRHRHGAASSPSKGRAGGGKKNKKSTKQGYDHHDTLHELQKLLEEFVTTSSKDNSNHTLSSSTTCPLLLPSQHDVHWQDEVHSQLVLPSNIWKTFRPPRKVSVVQWGIPRHAAWMKFLNAHDYPQHQPHYHSHWFQCAHCRKVFCSRYYFDQHMTRIHHNSTIASGLDESNHIHDPSTTIPTTTCPAVDWCETLILGGAAACAQTALHNEPYYDRGSGGLIQADRTLVYHQLRLQTHAVTASWCNKLDHRTITVNSHDNKEAIRLQQHQEQRIKACGTVMEQCFEPQLAQTLQTEICQHLFTCPRRHHHHQHPSLALPEHWKDEWDYYGRQAYAHPLLWFLVIFGLILCAASSRFWGKSGPNGYTQRYYGSGETTTTTKASKKNMRQHAAGTRLLQPLASSASRRQQSRGWWLSWFRTNAKQQSQWNKDKSKLQ